MTLDEATSTIQSRVGDADLNASVKFDFRGEGVVHVDGNQSPAAVTNEDKEADCTISMTLADFEGMTSGDLDPTTAFMMGKLKVTGNMGIAMKLSSALGG